MKITVIGTGYVGLVVGTCFAESGNDVICADIDENKIRRLQEGHIPIYEPGLQELVQRNVEDRRLRFTTNIEEAVQESLIQFIAVGTPPGEDGSADLRHVLSVARTIGKAMNGYKVVVDKSTVPVGTAEKVRAAIRQETEHDFDVVSNPEFLKEGAALDDFMKPDRVVIGTDDPRVAEIMKELYAPFVRTNKPIIVMDIASAELTKYAANAMLATRISFMNEIATLCELVGADINRVREGIGSDGRIGYSFLFAGLGYGGSCFPKDVKAIIRTGKENGFDFKILEAVEDVNQTQRLRFLNQIESHFGGDLTGKTLALWGLSFKPNTDDIREAPAITMIERLLAKGANLRVTDPEAIPGIQAIFGDRLTYCEKHYDTLHDADAMVLVTEWNEYRRPNFELMRERMKSAVVFDGRNIYGPSMMTKLGFTYYAIGVPVRVPAM